MEQSSGVGGARTSCPSLQLLSRGPCPVAQPAGAWQVLGMGQGVRESGRGRDRGTLQCSQAPGLAFVTLEGLRVPAQGSSPALALHM